MNSTLPITKWRHRVHDQNATLNKLFLLHDFGLLLHPDYDETKDL